MVHSRTKEIIYLIRRLVIQAVKHTKQSIMILGRVARDVPYSWARLICLSSSPFAPPRWIQVSSAMRVSRAHHLANLRGSSLIAGGGGATRSRRVVEDKARVLVRVAAIGASRIRGARAHQTIPRVSREPYLSAALVFSISMTFFLRHSLGGFGGRMTREKSSAKSPGSYICRLSLWNSTNCCKDTEQRRGSKERP